MTKEERERARLIAWRAANPERWREIVLASRLRCREKRREQGQRYRDANREALRKKNRDAYAVMTDEQRAKRRADNSRWRAANREEQRERVRIWRATNPEKIREYYLKWREANPEKVREKQLARLSRRASNPDSRTLEIAKSVIVKRTGLRFRDVPQALAEAHALGIRLHRAIHNRHSPSEKG